MKAKRKLPDGWRWEALGNCCKITNGTTGDQIKDSNLCPVTRIETISNGVLDFTKVGFTNLTEEERATYRLHKYDILFSHINSFERIGNSAIYLEETKELYHGMNLLRLTPNEKINPIFLFYALKAPNSFAYYRDWSQRAINQASINQTNLKKLPILLPPTLKDQKAIANELERKMAEAKKMRQAALRQKEAIAAMQGAILRETFPWKEGERLPEGWKWSKMRDACFINPTRDKGFSREPKALTSFVPMEAVDELKGRIAQKITRPYSEISKGYTFFKDGDVLFAKITPCMQNGKSAIAKDLIDGVGFGSTEFHILRPKPDITKEWIFYFIRTKEFRKRAEDHFDGSAGQQRVSTDFIERALIPLPPTLEDQITIANNLEQKTTEVVQLQQTAERQLEAVEALPGAILREVFDFEPERN